MAVEPVHHRLEANGLKQHHVEAGSGPPVILLHGFPDTRYAWRYRAAEEDVRQNDVGTKLSCPTLTLWGEDFESGGKIWDFLAIWPKIPDDLRHLMASQTSPYRERVPLSRPRQ